jgi:hypothetical protein
MPIKAIARMGISKNTVKRAPAADELGRRRHTLGDQGKISRNTAADPRSALTREPVGHTDRPCQA